jgi:hypothetical protein
MRKDAESECAGLKRLKKESQRKHGGKAVSETQSEYNKYIIVATSLKEAEVSTGRILELYRMRWQIELAWLKSLFHYGDIPVQLDASARAWFYGKLLLAALTETLLLQSFGIDALIDRIDLLPHICADSKRQRLPKLHLFSSA